MKKLMKGAAIGVLGLGLALGVATQANAMPGYVPGEHAYDDSCKTCHTTDPNGTAAPTDSSSPAPTDSSSPAPTDSSSPATTDNGGATTLPQTGAEGIYLNYLAGAGLLVPGAALLASRKKKH